MLQFPSEPPTSVPVLIICGEKDRDAPSKTFAWPQYRKWEGATKLIFEVSNGDHYVANGPAGGSEHETAAASVEIFMGINAMFAYPLQVFCPNECVFAPCPGFLGGTYNGPSGHAADRAPRGAIGGVALAWLRLFLQGDESARSQLINRPDIASGFEHSGVAGPLVKDESSGVADPLVMDRE